MEYEKLAKDEWFPIDLVRKPSVRTAQCSISECETASSSSSESGDSKETAYTILLMRQYKKKADNRKPSVRTAQCSISECETASSSSSESSDSKETAYTTLLMRQYKKKADNRKSFESRTAAAQEQQARDVNKNRSYSGGGNLPKDITCLLTLGPEKNNVGIKNLPVMITQVMYYKQSDTILYKLCCKDGLLQGTYGRGELEPQAHLTANLMGINVLQLDKAQTLTPYQAHDRYLKMEEKTGVAAVEQTVVSPSPAN
jgi:hypothetical protein